VSADVNGLQVTALAGAAYIFDLSSGQQIARLTGEGDKQFGYAVDIKGQTVAVGAPGKNLYEEWDPYVMLFDASGTALGKITHPAPNKATGFAPRWRIRTACFSSVRPSPTSASMPSMPSRASSSTTSTARR
jgi:hypothetical protein